jgi:Phage portal protein
MSIRSFLSRTEPALPGMNGHADVKFSAFGIENLPAEMREGIGMSGALAPRISRAEALQVPAVLRSRNLIAGTLGGLPVHLRNKERREVTGSEAPTTLFDQINPDVPDIVTYAQTYEDLFFESISWWRVLDTNVSGWPTSAEHIDWRRVRVDESKGIVYVDGYPVANNTLIRFDSPNPPLLVHAARAIRTCLLLDTTASNYSNTMLPLGYFTPKDGTRPNEDDTMVTGLLDKWEQHRRNRTYGYVGAAWELKALQFNAEQIQLSDQRQHAVLEIARAAGVDPEDLGVSTTSRTYQNAEQRRLDLLDFTLVHYMKAVEERLSMGDVTPRGWRAKVNLDAFLRSDTKTRMETYKIAREINALTEEEMRELEDRPTLPKGISPALPPKLVPVRDNEPVEEAN